MITDLVVVVELTCISSQLQDWASLADFLHDHEDWISTALTTQDQHANTQVGR